jgi:hypothetical protein
MELVIPPQLKQVQQMEIKANKNRNLLTTTDNIILKVQGQFI